MQLQAPVARSRRHIRASAVQTPLETYLGEINETRLLNAEQERELARRVLDYDDGEARDHMVRANLRLVVNIARGYLGKGLPLQDLIAEGNLGLMRAVEGFDPTMNTRFSTYASYWIKQSIKRAVINTGKTIRIPAYMNELLVKWRRATMKLQEELDRPPTQEEVAASMRLSKKKLTIIRRAIRIHNAVPQAEDEEHGHSIEEILTDENSFAPDATLALKDDLRQVLALVDKMDKREAAVLRLRYGLTGEDPLTLKDIGDRLNLTRERVRQIEVEALRKLYEVIAG
jgi:RNA polymerase primary sigma factor